MFVRKNRNRSGSVSVQIVSKAGGKYRVVKTVGSAKDPDEIEKLVLEAKNQIHHPENQLPLLPSLSKEDLTIQNFLEKVSNLQVHTIGPELIFGALFNRIGFNNIRSKLFRQITIARLAYPTSKLKTVDYLYRYRGLEVSVDKIYRFLDRFNREYKRQAETIAYQYTKARLKTIAVIFYDMTTLYFETEDEDDLRKIGFSKDGKFNKPQIMLGLLVGKHGYPISYNIFKGNTFEGHTLLPVLKEVQSRYGFGKPIVIADAALLSRKNLNNLSEQEYRFIIGGRIKNESEEVKKQISRKAKGKKDGQGFSISKKDGTCLIVTYSDRRAKKDVFNRERGLRKLRLRVKFGRLTKESINNRGYNKFLAIKGETKDIEIIIDEEKVKEDQKWDGLKGYLTNTTLSPRQVSQNYSHLWQIEKAFRISKTDLRIRPVHHYRYRRIEAHICIAFVAYTIYKELERLLVKRGVKMSPKRAGELTQTMYELEYELPYSRKKRRTLFQMDEEQQLLYDAIRKS